MEIRVRAGEVCRRCGDLTVFAGGLCRMCRMAPPPFERAVAYGPYEGRMRDAIHAFKYDRLRPAARGLGRMLAAAIAELADEAPVEMLVVPVPLHRAKHRERGFNQARLLAGEALAALKRSHGDWKLTLAPDALLRQRATEMQAGLSPHARRANMRGAFRVADAAAVSGRDILLIDDIMTTGATVRAAAKALHEAGAESVWVATLARAGRRDGLQAGAVSAEHEEHAEEASTSK